MCNIYASISGLAPNHMTRNVRVKTGRRYCRLITLSDQGPPIEVDTLARLKATSLADTVAMKLMCPNEEQGVPKNLTPLTVIAWGIQGRITKVDMFGKMVGP